MSEAPCTPAVAAACFTSQASSRELASPLHAGRQAPVEPASGAAAVSGVTMRGDADTDACAGVSGRSTSASLGRPAAVAALESEAAGVGSDSAAIRIASAAAPAAVSAAAGADVWRDSSSLDFRPCIEQAAISSTNLRGSPSLMCLLPRTRYSDMSETSSA